VIWSYEGPGANAKDVVRFLVGDTDKHDPLVSDEEILFFLEEFPTSSYHAAAEVAESLAARFSREVNQSADGLSWSGDSLSQKYYELADRLRRMAARKLRSGFAPYAGGLSKNERKLDDADDDLEKGHFRSHMHDNPRGNRQDELRPTQ